MLSQRSEYVLYAGVVFTLLGRDEFVVSAAKRNLGVLRGHDPISQHLRRGRAQFADVRYVLEANLSGKCVGYASRSFSGDNPWLEYFFYALGKYFGVYRSRLAICEHICLRF